jgi:hypothetical protein
MRIIVERIFATVKSTDMDNAGFFLSLDNMTLVATCDWLPESLTR